MYQIMSLLLLVSGSVFGVSPTTERNPFDPFPLEEPAPDAPTDSRFLGEFFYMLLMLGLLIGVVFLAGYVLRRLTSTRIEALNTTSRVKIMERRSLSQRSMVHIVEIDDKEYLIAESPGGITAVPLENSCSDKSS